MEKRSLYLCALHFHAALAFTLPCMAAAKAKGGSLQVPQQAGAAALALPLPPSPCRPSSRASPPMTLDLSVQCARTWGRSSSSLLAAILGRSDRPLAGPPGLRRAV